MPVVGPILKKSMELTDWRIDGDNVYPPGKNIMRSEIDYEDYRYR